MTDFRLILRLILPLCFFGTGTSDFLPDCQAQEPPSPLPETLNGEIPENLLPLTPENQTTPDAKRRIEAAAHFMQGVMLERRGEFQSAVREYQQAIASDPQAVEAYRALIKLSMRFGQKPQARELILKAIKHAPTDVQLLRLLGRLRLEFKELPEALDAFERASESPQIEKDSGEYVLLMAELALLYRQSNQGTKAADAYQVIFEALQHPEQFHLDSQTIDLLRSSGELSYDKTGIVFLKDKRYDLALEAFELATKNPRLKTEEIEYYKAEIYQSQGKSEKALAALQPYLDKNLQSRGLAPYELMTGILKSLEREEEIETRLDELHKQDPTNNFIVYALADLYQQQDQSEKAVDLYLKAIGRGADPEGYQGLMDVYYSQGKAVEWLGALSGLLGLGRNVAGIENQFKQVSDDSDFMDKLVIAAREQREAGSRKFNFPEAYIIGRLSAASKHTDYVEEFYQMAIDFRPARRPQLTGELAQYLMEQEEYERTETLLENTLSLPGNPNLRPIYSQLLARALFSQSYDLSEKGDLPTALAKTIRAQELSPENPLYIYRRGFLEYRSEHTETAITLFRSLIGKVEFDSLEQGSQMRDLIKHSYFLLSAILVQEGQIGEGEELLEVVYKNDPTDPSVNNDLGYLYADQNKNLEQAEKMIRIALDSEPENNAYLDSMAWVLYRRGKFEEALEFMLKAVEGSEDGDATLWDHLGDIYDKSGQMEKAKESWQTALKQAEQDDRRDEELIGKIRQKLGLPAAPQPLNAPKPAQASQ